MLQIQQRVNISGQACRSGLPARPNLAHAARPGASPSLPRRRVILKAQGESDQKLTGFVAQNLGEPSLILPLEAVQSRAVLNQCAQVLR
eukprot:177475-Pelagomonas_calceolata.AAC.2